jgi:hypothetical protein
MEAALRWLADAMPGTAEPVRPMDATPVPCGQSMITARRSDLYGYTGAPPAQSPRPGRPRPDHAAAAGIGR